MARQGNFEVTSSDEFFPGGEMGLRKSGLCAQKTLHLGFRVGFFRG